jgi:DNA-binding response OmpR family regulator
MDENVRKILFIDDDVFLEKIVRFNLKDEGYAFTATQNGEDAIKILESDTQDMIILDLIMPRMDGWKFLDWLREKSEFKSIPIIVLTAFQGKRNEIMEKYPDCRIVDILEKPFELTNLVAMIKGVFSA